MQNKIITKAELENLVKKYETEDFIKNDPIQFPHRFESPQDIEIASFLASLFAYGNRKIFVKKLDKLFEIMENKPLEFILNFNPKVLKDFNYRFAKEIDIIETFHILKKLYAKDGGLKALFEYGYSLPSPPTGESCFRYEQTCEYQKTEVMGQIQTMLQVVTDYFYANVQSKVEQGFYHLIPNPKNGGAMKRMNMFLRWMVRKPPVDLGLWNFIPTSELLIPLDVHVARVSKEMGLLKRNSNDFKAVLELSETLKKFDLNDPVKFDFAMFGYGISQV